jgi:hypothetical protein
MDGKYTLTESAVWEPAPAMIHAFFCELHHDVISGYQHIHVQYSQINRNFAFISHTLAWVALKTLWYQEVAVQHWSCLYETTSQLTWTGGPFL